MHSTPLPTPDPSYFPKSSFSLSQRNAEAAHKDDIDFSQPQSNKIKKFPRIPARIQSRSEIQTTAEENKNSTQSKTCSPMQIKSDGATKFAAEKRSRVTRIGRKAMRRRPGERRKEKKLKRKKKRKFRRERRSRDLKMLPKQRTGFVVLSEVFFFF